MTDADGDVPEGLPVEAIVNNTVCGTSETVKTGDGDSRITAYVVDVHSHRQTSGCGQEGDAVRIRIGDRLAPEAVEWEQGWVHFDIVFGDTTPDAVPTFTPTPEGQAEPTSLPVNEATPAEGSDDEGANPGDGNDDDNADATGGDDGSGEGGSEDSANNEDGENGAEGDDAADDEREGQTSSDNGGVTDSTPAAAQTGSGDGDGGFPVWAMILLVVGGVAAVGGGLGYMMSRSGGAATEPAEGDDTLSGS